MQCDDCDMYIGQTKGQIKTRFKEHKSKERENPSSRSRCHRTHENDDNFKFIRTISTSESNENPHHTQVVKEKIIAMNADHNPVPHSCI